MTARLPHERRFSVAERAAIGELFAFADVCVASAHAPVRQLGLLVFERMRRIIECDAEVLLFSPAQVADVCLDIDRLRPHLPTQRVN